MNAYETLTYNDVTMAIYDAVQKAKSPTSKLSMEVVRGLNYMTPDYYRFLNNEGLVVADGQFGPGRVLLKSNRFLNDDKAYVILDMNWLNMVAPFMPDYWPLWAATPAHETLNSHNSALLCATGKYFLNGGKTP